MIRLFLIPMLLAAAIYAGYYCFGNSPNKLTILKYMLRGIISLGVAGVILFAIVQLF